MSSLPQSLRYVSLIAQLLLSIFFVKKYVNVRNRNVPLGLGHLSPREIRATFIRIQNHATFGLYTISRDNYLMKHISGYARQVILGEKPIFP